MTTTDSSPSSSSSQDSDFYYQGREMLTVMTYSVKAFRYNKNNLC